MNIVVLMIVGPSVPCICFSLFIIVQVVRTRNTLYALHSAHTLFCDIIITRYLIERSNNGSIVLTNDSYCLDVDDTCDNLLLWTEIPFENYGFMRPDLSIEMVSIFTQCSALFFGHGDESSTTILHRCIRHNKMRFENFHTGMLRFTKLIISI